MYKKPISTLLLNKDIGIPVKAEDNSYILMLRRLVCNIKERKVEKVIFLDICQILIFSCELLDEVIIS